MSTIHNPTNFKPEDYVVEDYLDNQPPTFFGSFGFSPISDEQWRAILDEWKRPFIEYFGNDYRLHIHQCSHCGNGRVRYITVCRHIPTGEYVVFGTTCTLNLNFKNRDQYKAAQVRAKAELNHKKAAVYAEYQKYMSANPQLQPALECFESHKEIHNRNFFAEDIIRKLKQYGSLSERQRDCVIESIAKDHEYHAKKIAEESEVKGDAPSGRQDVEGEIVSTKVVDSYYGMVSKMLVKLTNNAKVWCTIPSSPYVERGDQIRLRATFTVSKEDPHFAFGKRPMILEVINQD